MSLFDEYSGDESKENRPKQPLWAIDLESEKEVLQWCNGEINYLLEEDEDRVARIRRNIAVYKGFEYNSQDTRTTNRDASDSRERVNKKISTNLFYDLAEDRRAILIKYKPAIAILPRHDEFGDKVDAKMTKAMLDHIWYINRFEGEITTKLALQAMVMGESFLHICWDKDKGDLSPAYIEAKKKYQGEKIPLLDDQGNQKLDEQGQPMFIEKPVKVGDVVYKTLLADNVFFSKDKAWDELDYLFFREVVNIEELKLDYPKQASKIKPSTEGMIYDYEKMQVKKTNNEVVKWTLYYKKGGKLKEGRKIVFTKDALLENIDYPYNMDKLPIVRFTDTDLPGENRGVSFYEMIKGECVAFSNITNMILRNQMLVSHPKWVMPVGSAQIDALGNDITIVQYKGPTPPQLVQSNPTPSELFKFREEIKNEAIQKAGISSVARGEPPAGIKAGVALQFLTEMESERYNNLILKWNETMRLIAEITILVAAVYYDESDQRMIKVAGKNNAWMSQYFDAKSLEKDYDIVIQNSSALPQSKAARIQTIMDLNKEFPNLLPPEQILDMIDLAQSEKYVDSITIAIRTAEAENEALLEKTQEEADLIAPEEFDDHIQHWKVHTRKMLDYSFKYETPKEKKDQLITHVFATEMLMIEKAKTNQAYAQLIGALPGFPMFYQEPQATPMQPMEAVVPAQGGAATEGLVLPPEMQVAPPMPNLEAQLATEPQVTPEMNIQPTGAI